MCNAIMAEVAGKCMSAVPSTLRGYRRLRVKDAHYPALVPDAESRVEGVVYRDVPESAWARLDRFEGEMYSRESVQVELADGSAVAAATYVVHGDFTSCLDETEWDFTAFLDSDEESFCKSYEGYRALI